MDITVLPNDPNALALVVRKGNTYPTGADPTVTDTVTVLGWVDDPDDSSKTVVIYKKQPATGGSAQAQPAQAQTASKVSITAADGTTTDQGGLPFADFVKAYG